MTLWTEDDSRDLDEQVRSLRAADRRDRRGSPATGKQGAQVGRKRPTPKQVRSGRWRAVLIRHGQYYSKTLDTQPEAAAWIDQMIDDKENP